MAETRESKTDALLRRVHDMLGRGVRIETEPGGIVVISWRRSYEGVLSDGRVAEANSIADALQEVLHYEDAVDAEERREGREVPDDA